MSAKPITTTSPDEPQIASLAERVAQANLANIMRKVKAGSSLTAAETRTLAEARRGDEAKAAEMIRRGMAVMQRIREIIEGSPLPKSLQRKILDDLANINV
jgi:hypothetical protein